MSSSPTPRTAQGLRPTITPVALVDTPYEDSLMRRTIYTASHRAKTKSRAKTRAIMAIEEVNKAQQLEEERKLAIQKAKEEALAKRRLLTASIPVKPKTNNNHNQPVDPAVLQQIRTNLIKDLPPQLVFRYQEKQRQRNEGEKMKEKRYTMRETLEKERRKRSVEALLVEMRAKNKAIVELKDRVYYMSKENKVLKEVHKKTLTETNGTLAKLSTDSHHLDAIVLRTLRHIKSDRITARQQIKELDDEVAEEIADLTELRDHRRSELDKLLANIDSLRIFDISYSDPENLKSAIEKLKREKAAIAEEHILDYQRMEMDWSREKLTLQKSTENLIAQSMQREEQREGSPAAALHAKLMQVLSSIADLRNQQAIQQTQTLALAKEKDNLELAIALRKSNIKESSAKRKDRIETEIRNKRKPREITAT